MVTERYKKQNKEKETQGWCQSALLPEIHVPIVPIVGAAIRGDQGVDRPAQ